MPCHYLAILVLTLTVVNRKINNAHFLNLRNESIHLKLKELIVLTGQISRTNSVGLTKSFCEMHKLLGNFVVCIG